MTLDQLKIISAGAGSGKTYRLTEEMVALLKSETVRATGIIATTFTRKAAAELQERVRVKLLSEGLTQQADDLTNALIGTVHGLGVKLLRRFCFEAGVSPQVDILPDSEQQNMFNQSLAAVLSMELMEEMDTLVERLGLNKRSGFYDWRKEVHRLVDVARANDFSLDDLEQSRQQSWTSFQNFLPSPTSLDLDTAYQQLKESLDSTAELLDQGDDQTKTTSIVIDKIRATSRELNLKSHLNWYQWAMLTKLKPGAKSREKVEPLKELALLHEQLPAFHRDIQAFIDHLFHTAIAALQEYDQYKKRRGLIDYTDMEVLVSRLLDQPVVQEVLRSELDLLMVDEFQDTSPIQLEIFLKLSQLANYSVWVGDPKQSIYGFRGAEPRLMQAIIEAAGGIKSENVQTRSWRSRADLVHTVNAIFDKAFPDLPTAQIALEPVRVATGNEYAPAEPPEMEQGLIHWHFITDDDNRRAPGKPWMEESIARSLQAWLAEKPLIQAKGTPSFRPAQAGDVAVLCRSNAECETVAEALHKAGLRAAIARAGLLQTAEARLVLACLKYVLNARDSLSVAEILLLAGQQSLQNIVEHRLDYLDTHREQPKYQWPAWAGEQNYIKELDELRPRLGELSSTETLNLLLEELDLRRCIVRWGRREQRLANLDELRKLSLQYEENCNNTHTAASLGGFLLWLNQLAARKEDYQGAGEDPLAVNVLTYHRSKGLEWPVVVCHSLEQKLRADLWGIDLIPETDTIDLNQVLKGRWLRYWVNPYADQQTRMPLLERLTESAEQAAKKQQALAEEARLLYVGLTRARDFLILPTRMNSKTGWLNRVCQQGDEGTPTLDPNTHESPWEWKGQFLDKKTQTFVYPRTFPSASTVFEDAPFLQAAPGKAERPGFRINPTEEAPALGLSFQAGRTLTYATDPNWPEEADPATLASVLRHFFLADNTQFKVEDRRQIAQGLLDRFALPESVSADWVLQRSEQWQVHLQQQWPQADLQKGVPLRHPQHGRLFTTQLDWILTMNMQTTLIQNSRFPGDDNKRKATELGPFFHFADQAWQAAGGFPAGQYWVHFVLPGKVVEIVV